MMEGQAPDGARPRGMIGRRRGFRVRGLPPQPRRPVEPHITGPAARPDAGDRHAGGGAAAVRRRGGRLVATEAALAVVTAAR
jgi:hypothetical protein